MMKYQLTLKDKLYFLFHQRYIDRFHYLFSKIEQHYNNYFRKNNINFPIYYNKFLMLNTANIIRSYEDNFL